MVYLLPGGIAATEGSADRIDEPDMRSNDVMCALLPPVYYRNELGVVTNRRQFQEFYRIAGWPIGPYVFARH
jgi:hypothetical protein